MNDVLDETEKKRRHLHDAMAAIRFLENLHAEIKYAKSLEDIQDELILQKFSEVIEFISSLVERGQYGSTQKRALAVSAETKEKKESF